MKPSGKTKILLCGIILTPLCLTLLRLALSFSIWTSALRVNRVICSNTNLPASLQTRRHFCRELRPQQCHDPGASFSILCPGRASEKAVVSNNIFPPLALSYSPLTISVPVLFLPQLCRFVSSHCFLYQPDAAPVSQSVPVTQLFSLPACYLKVPASPFRVSSPNPPRSPNPALHLLNAASSLLVFGPVLSFKALSLFPHPAAL